MSSSKHWLITVLAFPLVRMDNVMKHQFDGNIEKHAEGMFFTETQAKEREHQCRNMPVLLDHGLTKEIGRTDVMSMWDYYAWLKI